MGDDVVSHYNGGIIPARRSLTLITAVKIECIQPVLKICYSWLFINKIVVNCTNFGKLLLKPTTFRALSEPFHCQEISTRYVNKACHNKLKLHKLKKKSSKVSIIYSYLTCLQKQCLIKINKFQV